MSNDVVKLFETITGIKFDVMLENVRNSYEWTLMSEKKRRAKKRYLRRYYRHAPSNTNEAQGLSLCTIRKRLIQAVMKLSLA